MKAADRLAVVVALTPLLATLLTLTTFEWSDNGLFLAAAERVLHGDAPYRDFFWFYLPGGPYLFGALEGIFGRHYLVIRGCFAVVIFLTYYWTLRLAREIHQGDAGWGLVSAIALLSWGVWRAILNHNLLVPCAGLASILLLLRALDGHGARRLIVAGIPAAVVLAFNHLGAVLLCLGAAASLPLARAAWQPRRIWRDSFLVWTAPAALLAMVLLLGAIRGGNAEMLDAAVLRPLLRYLPNEPHRGGLFELRSALAGEGKFNVLGGALAHLVRVGRLLIMALAVRFLPFVAMITVAVFLWRKRADSRERRALAVTLVVGSFLFLEAFKGWRADRAGLALLPLSIAFWSIVRHASPRPRWALYASGVVLALSVASFSAGTVAYIARTWRAMPLVETPLGELRSTTMEEAQARSQLVAALRARGARTLFAYYYQPALYPLTGLAPTTRYQYFTTILFTREQLEKVCDDLRRAPADVAVSDGEWDSRPELPDTLDRCVRELYVEDQRIESGVPGHPYILMRRK